MAGVSYWEGLLVEEITEVKRVLEGVRKTKTYHSLSTVCIVERRFGNAFELKKSFREELDRTDCSPKIRQQQTNRLKELDQQLLALQINWDVMSNEESDQQKKGKDAKGKKKKGKEEDDADSTSTGWTAWTGWTTASPSVSSHMTAVSTGTSNKATKTKKKSKRKTSTKFYP